MAFQLRLLITILMLNLAGCATPPPSQQPPPEPPHIPETTWQQADCEIHEVTIETQRQAIAFARGQMEQWRQLASDRAETDFIPWFSSYTTQQWLTAKVAWYTLSSNPGDSPPAERLASYMQEQYYDRVLAPTAKTIDPVLLVAQTTHHFIRQLRQQLALIPRRHGIPEDQFRTHLNGIRAIAIDTSPPYHATLLDITRSEQAINNRVEIQAAPPA
jgi:hypothetical protein